MKTTELTQEMLNTFYAIPAKYRAALSKYYILRWSKAFFDLQPTLDKGFMYHQGQRYEISYAVKHVLERRCSSKGDSVMLSFRCPTIAEQQKGLVPTVYVTILTNHRNYFASANKN